jgi:gliding motility-associated-like protein
MIERPTAPTETGEQQRCGSGEITLEVSGGTEGSYRWYESANSTTPIPGEVSSQFRTGQLTGSKTYYVRIAGESCQSEPTAVEARINPIPNRPEVQHSLPCGQGEVQISVSNSQEGMEYLWYPAEDGSSLHQGSSLNLQLKNDTLIYVRAGNGFCQSEAVAVELSIIEKPQIDAGEDQTILKGESIDLQASGNYTSLQWQPHESLQYPGSPTPKVSPTFTHTYLVTAVNEEGCENTDSVTVHVLDKFPVPNAFSPNNDGQNDSWEIPNIENYPNASLKVFNRWGNQVFHSQGYSTPWDGTHNGQPLPSGSYYFILKLSKETDPVKGTVLIMR